MCVFEDSMPPSMSVTREQEVWGMYGIYTAQKHKNVFKIIHKRHFKIHKKEVQIPPKSSPRGDLKQKNQSDAGRSRKNKFWAAGSPVARPKRTPKWTSKQDQEHPNPRSICFTKERNLWRQFRGHRSSFWREKWRRLEYISGDSHRHELIVDFQRMYCTVCLFLQSKLCEIRNGKQSEARLFHLPHEAIGEGRKKGPKKPPK